ncbi:MAG: M56 family metallopeptidase [Clostridiaceae bacterium]
MEKLFLSILNMSLTASYVIFFVLMFRTIFKNAHNLVKGALWLLIAFRLVVPFSIESALSLIPRNIETAYIAPSTEVFTAAPQVISQVKITETVINAVTQTSQANVNIDYTSLFIKIASLLWAGVFLLLLTRSVVSYIKLKKHLNPSTLIEEGVYETSIIKTPFVLGIINPKIYIPSEIVDEEREYILQHEKTHIARLDHIKRIVAYFITLIHWFNPLVWLAFHYFGNDLEVACDKVVLENKPISMKKAYATSIVRISADNMALSGHPLAFGEGNSEDRVKRILNNKKPKTLILMIAIPIAAVLLYGLITNPLGKSKSLDWIHNLKASDISQLELLESGGGLDRYKPFTKDEIIEVVGYLNSISGKQTSKGIEPGKVSQTLLITTNDGMLHKITSFGGERIIIDDSAFIPDKDWMSKWNFVPTDFAPDKTKLLGNGVRYELEKNNNGMIIGRTVVSSPEDTKKITDVLMDYYLQSTFFTGSAVNKMGESIKIETFYSDGTKVKHFLYSKDDKSVVSAMDQSSSYVKDGSFKSISDIFSINAAIPREYPGFTKAEIEAAEKVVREYFKGQENRDREAVMKTMVPFEKPENVQFIGEGVTKLLSIDFVSDDNFRLGAPRILNGEEVGIENIIVFKVNYNVKLPEDSVEPIKDRDVIGWSMILVRKDKNSPWLIQNQGY